MLIKNSVITGRFLLRAFSPFHASGHLCSRFIQTEAMTNPRKKDLEKRTTSGLIHLYVKRIVRQFCCICFETFYLGFSCAYDYALSFP